MPRSMAWAIWDTSESKTQKQEPTKPVYQWWKCAAVSPGATTSSPCPPTTNAARPSAWAAEKGASPGARVAFRAAAGLAARRAALTPAERRAAAGRGVSDEELAFFGGWLDAQDAKRFGLVADVFGQGELEEEISSRAAQLEALPPIALAEIKRGLNASFEKELPEALAEEAAAQEKLAGTADFAEAMRAFLEKRPAVFRGH